MTAAHRATVGITVDVPDGNDIRIEAGKLAPALPAHILETLVSQGALVPEDKPSKPASGRNRSTASTPIAAQIEAVTEAISGGKERDA